MPSSWIPSGGGLPGGGLPGTGLPGTGLPGTGLPQLPGTGGGNPVTPTPPGGGLNQGGAGSGLCIGACVTDSVRTRTCKIRDCISQCMANPNYRCYTA